MRVMTRERLDYEIEEGVEIPVFAYGIDADSYEEAYNKAKEMFEEDYINYNEEKVAEMKNLIKELMLLQL